MCTRLFGRFHSVPFWTWRPTEPLYLPESVAECAHWRAKCQEVDVDALSRLAEGTQDWNVL